jgi:shikimate dehydrogenase
MGSVRAAIVGSPVAHSLSPVLHEAAYDALGLAGWRYERLECAAADFARMLGELGPEWAGLSVTMPDKRAALEAAHEATGRARAIRAANTLVPLPGGGWRADCTDIDGVRGALRYAAGYSPEPGRRGLVLGAGGSAAAALAAFVALGIAEVTVLARDPGRAQATVCAGRGLGLAVTLRRFDELGRSGLAAEVASSHVVVSTLPADASGELADVLADAPFLLDAIYDPWPTPLAEAVGARGGRLATGLDMLLHQAFGQVEQFTGLRAPRAAMRDALRAATGRVANLPIG